MYLSLSEKKEYIDKDFKEHFIIPMGELPADHIEAQEYIHKLMHFSEMWGERYRHNTLGLYALKLLDDFVTTVQQSMYRLYGGEP